MGDGGGGVGPWHLLRKDALEWLIITRSQYPIKKGGTSHYVADPSVTLVRSQSEGHLYLGQQPKQYFPLEKLQHRRHTLCNHITRSCKVRTVRRLNTEVFRFQTKSSHLVCIP